MSTASSASSHTRDPGKDEREGMHGFRKAAAESADHIESDLAALRDDFRRLADELAAIIANAGAAAWRHAKTDVDEAVADAEAKGREAADAVREVSGHFIEAFDKSIKARPYTTLAMAAGLAFLLGALWRR